MRSVWKVLVFIFLMSSVLFAENKFTTTTDVGKPVRTRIPGTWSGDSLLSPSEFVFVIAGETTSPGNFMLPDTSTGKYVKADSSKLRVSRIIGVVIDSVLADSLVRIQTTGSISYAWWNGLLGPVGSTAINDSIIASHPAPEDAARTNTLPVQPFGTVLDSITIFLNFGEVWYYEN